MAPGNPASNQRLEGNGPRGPQRRRRDLTDEIATRIVEHVGLERLGKGTHLSAQDMADRLGVSRSPVLRALELLSDKGVVIHRPNCGYFVAQSGTDKVLNLAPRNDLGEIYLRIAEDRLRGVLGEIVSEAHLRERYGLTRAEVGALMARIADEGWAERRRGYGWKFSPALTTPEALEQSYRLRLAVEPAALLEPLFRLPDAEARRWQQAEERLLAGEIETLSPDALHMRGVRFHEALAEASGNPFLLDALRRVNRVRRLLAYRSMVDRSRYYGQAEDHLIILDHARCGRKEEAAEAMRAHLERVMHNLSRLRPLLECGRCR